MNFEELARIWNSTDRDLDKAVLINRSLVMKFGLSKVKARLYEIKWTSIIHIVAGIFFFFFLTRFLFAHFNEMRFFLPALMLLAITVYGLVFEIRRWSLYHSVDSATSVMAAQKKLARLRRMERMDRYSLLLIIPLFSAPFLIVAARALAGVDLYAISGTWLAYQASGSVVVAGIVVYFLKRFPDKRLREAELFLKELKEEERDS